MCTSVFLVGESKEELNAPQFMDFAAADLLDYAISSSQSHFRSDSIVQGSLVDQLPLQVLGEDTDPKAICQWSVSTSPGLNPLDASADSGSDIGTADFWSYERSDTLVRMSVNTSGEKSETHVRAVGSFLEFTFDEVEVLVESSAPLFGESIRSIVQFLLEVWSSPNLESSTRHHVLQLISWIAKYKFNSLKKHKLSIPILQVMCPLLAELEELLIGQGILPTRMKLQIVATLSIPVIANGDVFEYEDF
ncbi:hypothetical protein AgCh_009428 [Apium graveolens]